MSVAMHRSTAISSSSLQRGSNGAAKPMKVPSYASSRTSTFGTSSLGTPSSNSRTANQGRSFRPLPNGPGPLPNRSVVDKSGTVQYVAARNRTSYHVSHQKSSALDSPTTRRKTSNDSGYGSGGRDSTFRYGSLANSGRISKSLSHLSTKDETSDISSSNRSRTDSSSTRGVSEKTGLSYKQRSFENDHLNAKHTNNTISGSMYRSTTHLDYKDPREDKKSLTKPGRSFSSERDLSNSLYTSKSSSRVIIDVDKARKETITALPGDDLKCSRRSSLSSSNSSPSVSEYAYEYVLSQGYAFLVTSLFSTLYFKGFYYKSSIGVTGTVNLLTYSSSYMRCH